jgi:Family of unknown function (DUF6463)
MTLTKQRASSDRRGFRPTKRFGSSERRGVRLTKAGGWIALVFGAVHVIVAPLESRSRDLWSQVVGDGWWNTFTLDEPTTLAEFDRAERFWVTLGSWGVPLLVLGAYIVWSTYQGHRVPAWIGWIIIAWGLIFATALPASPGWLLPIIGGLIVLGDRRRAQAMPLRTGHESWSDREAA